MLKKEEVCNNSGYSYWEFERIIAWSFNRLKGKVYNLIEASVENAEQKKALIGLVKGFANDEFKRSIEEARYCGQQLGILTKAEIDMPISSEPLENKNGIFGN